jgi:predicted AlkP superfamily pyrophosphatase or phosphodiesterase
MANKLIVYMIDGVAAEHYHTESGRFPHFASLERRGFRIHNLHSEVLGTSLPGRTSMLTGVTADVSGVYANKIWNGEEFRYSSPDDVRVPTIPARARAAGKTVATINAGMIRQEDTDIMKAPWFVDGGLIQRARDAEPDTATESWLRVVNAPVSETFVKACEAAGIPSDFPQMDRTDDRQRTFYGMISDQLTADWVGALAASDEAPDLIWAEFLVTDTFQHYSGYKSEMARWSVAQADMAVGKVLHYLREAGKLDEWNIAVMSDHGHSEVTSCLHPQNIIPGVRVQCEGGSLLVAPKDADELKMVTEKLAEYDVEPFPNDCIPAEMRDHVYAFVSPSGISFEDAKPDYKEPTGIPTAISTHGLKPGMAGDDRFALFAGPDIPQGSVSEANAMQIAPTLAKIMGLPLDGFAAEPIF